MNSITPTPRGMLHPEKRLKQVMRLLFLGWITAKSMSLGLWLKDRALPTAPVTALTDWPAPVHFILLAVSMTLLLLLIVFPSRKPLIAALLGAELIACLADQMRWQPWEYQYLFTLLIFLLHRGDARRTLAAIALIMACTYLYSGLGKLNEGYLVLIWDRLFLQHVFKLNLALRQNWWVFHGGYVTAAIEILLAAGLFFPRTRKLAAWGTIAMHLLILYALGPLGTDYNRVVWPWNVLMIILLILLFIRPRETVMTKPLAIQGWNRLVILFWMCLPALNYFGWWDNYLSCRLYSGHLPHMAFCLKNPEQQPELMPFLSAADGYKVCSGDAMVNFQNWSMKELGVPPYPELRVYKQVARRWLEKHPDTGTRVEYYRIKYSRVIERIQNP